MESAKKLIINIVTWNSVRYLPQLFESIDAQTSTEFTVSVIDNASTDGTLPWLEARGATVPVLKNFRNLGFSRAHNQGISLALSRFPSEEDLSQKYILILNPDIQLAPACIAELIAYMDTHPDVAIAGPKLLKARVTHSEDSDVISVDKTDVLDSMGLVLHRSRATSDRGAGETDRGQYDRISPFGISGAAMLFRASCIKQLILSGQEVFDEHFFAYKEDVDLCWRARLLGLRMESIPAAVAWHIRYVKDPGGKRIGGLFNLLFETWSRPGNIVRASRRNQIWMEWKNDDGINRFFHFPWLAWRGMLAIGACFVVPQYVRAYLEAWRGRSIMREKRRLIMARRKTSPEEMRKWFV
ncbi:MAG: glycosyltransferase family 2 protein [Patescibacteria group bacterium]